MLIKLKIHYCIAGWTCLILRITKRDDCVIPLFRFISMVLFVINCSIEFWSKQLSMLTTISKTESKSVCMREITVSLFLFSLSKLISPKIEYNTFQDMISTY